MTTFSTLDFVQIVRMRVCDCVRACVYVDVC